jgi:cytochrome c
MRYGLPLAATFGLGLAQMVSSQTSLQYPGCTAVTASDFKAVTVVDKTIDPTLVDPTRFYVTKSGDVYYMNRDGSMKIKKAAGTLVDMGKIPVPPLFSSGSTRVKLSSGDENEFGLTGFTLDPNFETTPYIYVHYQARNPDELRISRIPVVNDKLDLGNEKILIRNPWQFTYCCHTGGDMQFDDKGDLWVTVGNNTRNPAVTAANGYVDEALPDGDDQGHSANTNDLRGKIIRIHPTPDGSYTIPSGNLKDAYASLWTTAELAKVKPEIYSMGHRNPYTISVDPVKGWLMWGDVGPDNGYKSEEFNLTDKPGFFGWPYFAGSNLDNPNYSFRLNKNPEAPMNTSPNNTGVQKLPPAIPAIVGYTQSCAITGPIYRYVRYPNSSKKVPPHFDGKWFGTDFNAGWIKVFSVSEDGKSVTSELEFWPDRTLDRPISLNIGQDGILYSLAYGRDYWAAVAPTTKLIRWEYQGAACAGPTAVKQTHRFRKAQTQWLSLGANPSGAMALPEGTRSVALYSLQGKKVWEAEVHGTRSLSVPHTFSNGLYRAKIAF